MTEQDTAQIAPNSMDELRQAAVMIRTWMPECFPTNAQGQVHFVRVVMESVAAVIDRVLTEDAAYKATADEIHACYHEQHQRAFRLHQAIGAIWSAPVYQDRNRDNGISLEMIEAIRSAARAAGYIGEDAPLSPQLAEIDAELQRLNARGIYPKLASGLSVAEMASELRKL